MSLEVYGINSFALFRSKPHQWSREAKIATGSKCWQWRLPQKQLQLQRIMLIIPSSQWPGTVQSNWKNPYVHFCIRIKGFRRDVPGKYLHFFTWSTLLKDIQNPKSIRLQIKTVKTGTVCIHQFIWTLDAISWKTFRKNVHPIQTLTIALSANWTTSWT